MARLLVVDDDTGLLQLIAMRLESAGHEVLTATSGVEGLERFRAERPQVVVTDLRMDGMDGHALFERLQAEAPSIPVIILTAHGSIPEAVAATQRGVFAFLTKPFDGQELLARVDQAVTLTTVAPGGDEDWRADIIAVGVAMDELLRQARRAAEGNGPLLILGPHGAGKRLLAEAVHKASRRRAAPFIALRCAALPEQEAEPFLFGQLAGGKGGRAAPGQVQAAAGGTLFLGDVEALTAGAQARLLRLLREGTVLPVGATEAKPIDLRVICASASRGLDKAIREGTLRQDLYYRMATTVLELPSLESRREDIPPLVAHFTGRVVARDEPRARNFAPEALELLQSAPWPGNVRQLASVVERALHLAVTPLVPAALVRKVLRETAEQELMALDEARRAFEHDYLVQLLQTTGGNVSRAAQLAQRNRTEFYKLLARHALDPADFKPSA